MPVEFVGLTKTEGRATAPSFRRIPENEDAMKRWIDGEMKRAKKAVRKNPLPREANMIKVRMLRTRPGGIDGGIKVVVFQEGKVYATDGSGDGYIDELLAMAFLRCGHAVEFKPEEIKQKPAHENKMEKAVSNKRDGRRHLK